MKIRPIRDEAEYEKALAAFERCFDDEPEPETPAADRFELLGILLRDYERRRWPLGTADPVSVLHFAIETAGRSQADLSRILGSRSRASEVLSRRRPLTLDMIRRISAAWHLPVAALADAYPVVRPRTARGSRPPKPERAA